MRDGMSLVKLKLGYLSNSLSQAQGELKFEIELTNLGLGSYLLNRTKLNLELINLSSSQVKLKKP